jgi:hypothetical protein
LILPWLEFLVYSGIGGKFGLETELRKFAGMLPRYKGCEPLMSLTSLIRRLVAGDFLGLGALPSIFPTSI